MVVLTMVLSMRSFLSLSEAKESRSKDNQKEVENEESEQHPNVSPPIVVPDIQWKEEVVSNRVRTVPTSGGGVSVFEVSAKG
jgi:hypothetical protein